MLKSGPDLSWRIGVRKSFLSASMKIEALGERATDEVLTATDDGLALGWVKGGIPSTAVLIGSREA